MYSSFNGYQRSFNSVPDNSQRSPLRNNYKEMSHNNFPVYEENQQYNGKQANYGEEAELMQVPPHLKLLFNSGDQPVYDHKNAFIPQAGYNKIAANNMQNGPAMGQNYPNFTPFQGYNGAMFPVEQTNTNTNTNNQPFPIELNSSNLSNGNSRNISVNNTSQDGTPKPDMSTSGKKNMSSRTYLRNLKNQKKTLNDDITLIERIDPFLNQVTLNHNKICAFCSKMINIKRSNFQNISTLLSAATNRYYLVHFDCYLKSKLEGAQTKVVPLTNLSRASSQTSLASLEAFDAKNYSKSGRRTYSVSLEGYHPVSSYLLFKLEKISHGLEHATQHNQLLHLDFSKKTTSVLEPTMLVLPFNEFRLVVTVHLSHSEEDPYVFEFIVDLSQANLSADQSACYAQASYTEDGNNITLGTQFIHDTNSTIKDSYQMNLDTSIQSTGSVTEGKPEFGKNVFLALKHLTATLPLVRNELKGKISVTAAAAEGTSRLNPKMPSQSRLPNKIHLNPDAPLFASVASPGLKSSSPSIFNQSKQQGAINLFPVMPNGMDMNGGYKQPPMNMKPNMPNGFQENNPALFFNTPLFSQNLHFGDDRQQPSQAIKPQPIMDSVQNNGNFIPPGLGALINGDSNFQPQTFYPNQQSGENYVDHRDTYEMNQPHIYNKQMQHENYEEGNYSIPDRPQTPETMPPQMEGEIQSLNRGRLKGHVTSLYTAVLNKGKRENSLSNSPSINRIQNQYFSNVSTPKSANDPNPVSSMSPLSKFVRAESHNDVYGGDDNNANVPFTEDMVDNFKLEDHKGNVVGFAKTYHGSRILQKFFPKANQQEIEIVIHEIQDKMDELMLDPYANYMFQSLAQSCSSEQRYYLLQKIAPSMIRVAHDRKGTHSLQAIVSLINRDVEDKLIKEILDGRVLELSFDAQATHLIQKLVVSISINNIGFIYEPVIERFSEVANNSFGLCVLKQLMTKVDKTPAMKNQIIDLLHYHLEDLIQNPFGNYAIQHALDIYPQDCDKILDKIIDKIVQYSNQKFSSNVIEKCFVNTSLTCKKKFVVEIAKSDRLTELMKNKYGNYVILKILSTADVEDKKILAQSLVKNVNSVNVPKYKNRWIQFLEENPMKIPGLNAQTIKPSHFKTANGYVDSAGTTSASEINSPKTADGWKGQRDEKSHFYHDKTNKGFVRQDSNNSQGWDEHIEEQTNYTNKNNQGNWSDQRNYRNGGANTQGQAGGSANNSGKKPKNFNQKFYEKNQYHGNKNGHNNNFY